jgi:hypothetical protein
MTTATVARGPGGTSARSVANLDAPTAISSPPARWKPLCNRSKARLAAALSWSRTAASKSAIALAKVVRRKIIRAL